MIQFLFKFSSEGRKMLFKFGKNFLKNSLQVQKYGRCASIIHFHRQQLQLQPFRPHISMRTFASERDSGGPKWIRAMLHKILLRLKPRYLHFLPKALKVEYVAASKAKLLGNELDKNLLQCFICEKPFTRLSRFFHKCQLDQPFYEAERKFCPELFEAHQNGMWVELNEHEADIMEIQLRHELASKKMFPTDASLCNSAVYLILDSCAERCPTKWVYVGSTTSLKNRINTHRSSGRRQHDFIVFMDGLSIYAAKFVEYILTQMKGDLRNGKFEPIKPVKPYSDKEWREKLVQLLLYRIHHGVPEPYIPQNGRIKRDQNSVQNEVSSEAAASGVNEEADNCEVEEQQNVEAEESEFLCQNASEHSTLDCNESALMRENQEKSELLADDNVGEDVKCYEILYNTDSGYKLTYKFVICKFCNTTSYLHNMKTHLKRAHGIHVKDTTLDSAEPYITKMFIAPKDHPRVKELREQWKRKNLRDVPEMVKEAGEYEVGEQQNVEAVENATCDELAFMRENQQEEPELDDSVGQDEKCNEIVDNTVDSEHKEYQFVICKFCNYPSYLVNLKRHLKCIHGIHIKDRTIGSAEPYIIEMLIASKDSPRVRELREQWKRKNLRDVTGMNEKADECEVEEQQSVEAEEGGTQQIQSKECQGTEYPSTRDCDESALVHENQEKLGLADDSMKTEQILRKNNLEQMP